MRKIYVINGPNLNLLGVREPDIYGKEDYSALCLMIRTHCKARGVEAVILQSNHEGDLVDYIQEARSEGACGIVINPAAYTHTSIALLDAVKAVGIPTVEVHISRVEEREDFRQISYIRAACKKSIIGHGLKGYTEAIDFLLQDCTQLSHVNKGGLSTMKKLGFGCMRLPLLEGTDPTSIDLEQVKEMVDAFLREGFTYFDTAYMYHNYQSECFMKRALVERHPRESYLLADKLPSMMLKEEGDQERIFAEQLEKCGVDYFDYYLVHCLNEENFAKAETFDSFGFLARLKKEGRIRHMGFSFHDSAEMLDRILTRHPEVDFVQIQLNYKDWENEAIQSRLCLEVCIKHSKPVIVMEPVKGGMLANLPPRAISMLKEADAAASPASWAVRFAAGQENVFMVLSGMSNMAQLTDNISYMKSFEPLKEEEIALLARVSAVIDEDIAVACTACRYCVEGCPQHIDIPTLFSLYNDLKTEDREQVTAAYREQTARGGRASDCIKCKKCVKACPQHIRIPVALKQVAKTFE